mgnify:CR=1 FL=1
MRWRLLLCLLALTACMSAPPGASTGPARILVIGDSLMAWNRLRGASVAKALSAQLGEPVRDNSVSGAVHDLGGKPAAQGSHATIARQYRSGNWDWVVMDGGGNNLLFGCGCSDCGPQLDAAIAAIRAHGWGVLLYLRQEGRGIGLVNKLRAYALQDQGYDTVDANLRLGFPVEARDFAIAGRMLALLNIPRIRLMTNNPEKVARLEKQGVEQIGVAFVEEGVALRRAGIRPRLHFTIRLE